MTASIFSGVHNFFHSGTWKALELALIAFVVVFWLATVFWVWKDASRRIDDDRLLALATLIGAVPPFVGPLIYMLFRPPEYLEDVRERELEIRAIESRLGGPDLKCTVCGCEIEPDFLVCPVCTTKLRSACTECGRPLEPAWQVCPYCEAPVPVGGPVALAQRPTRRSRSSSSG
ncbi:MAG TPA: zinc ribbon domain-containing protein [Gaiellaceae bacterium]|nr:zinc ribbon domain-containing protein [Gaiellaceae bacterium]